MTISQQTIDDLAGLTRDLGAAPAWQAVHRVLCELVCEVQRLDKLPSGDAPPQDRARLVEQVDHWHNMYQDGLAASMELASEVRRLNALIDAKGGDAPQEPSGDTYDAASDAESFRLANARAEASRPPGGAEPGLRAFVAAVKAAYDVENDMPGQGAKPCYTRIMGRLDDAFVELVASEGAAPPPQPLDRNYIGSMAGSMGIDAEHATSPHDRAVLQDYADRLTRIAGGDDTQPTSARHSWPVEPAELDDLGRHRSYGQALTPEPSGVPDAPGWQGLIELETKHQGEAVLVRRSGRTPPTSAGLCRYIGWSGSEWLFLDRSIPTPWEIDDSVGWEWKAAPAKLGGRCTPDADAGLRKRVKAAIERATTTASPDLPRLIERQLLDDLWAALEVQS